MTLYQLLKANENRSQGKEVMWETVKIISDMIAPMKETNKDMYWKMLRDVFAVISKGHFDKMFAEWQVAQMYYVDKTGLKHHCSLTLEQAEPVYNACRPKLKYDYNVYDFYVTWCMLYTDNIMMYKSWWPNATEEQLNEKVTEATVNYLNDDDDKEHKIWNRFNS